MIRNHLAAAKWRISTDFRCEPKLSFRSISLSLSLFFRFVLVLVLLIQSHFNPCNRIFSVLNE